MQRWGVVRLAPGEELCDYRKQFGKGFRISWLSGPQGIRFKEITDGGSQGKDVEDVDVVVTPCRQRMSEVQKLKKCGAEERRQQRGLPRSERISVCWSSVCLKEVVAPEYIAT